MRKILYIIILAASALYSQAQTPAQNEVTTDANLDSAKANLKRAHKELNSAYAPFRRDAETQINDNDRKIKELRAGVIKPDKSKVNEIRNQKIDDLQKRNTILRNRLYAYETERTDWEVFKSTFNRDKEKLHAAFHDFDRDMKK
jgi:uncharacterized protein YpmB